MATILRLSKMSTINLNQKYVHFYNHVAYTKCPMFFSFAIYTTFTYLLLGMNYHEFFYKLLLVSLVFLAIFSSAWISEIYTESISKGQYTEKVYGTLLSGFCLFVFTEFLIFFGFFWALFDRYFNMSSLIFSNYTYFMYYSETIGWVKPIQGLCCLYFSGSFCNYAHYLYFYRKDLVGTIFSLYYAIILGIIFLYIQYEEFNHLSFKINDHVINSCFYLLAGFHGFHVSIGLYFLITQYDRFVRFQFTRGRHFGYVLSMIYWHFVDVVWFFLFYVFYIYIFCDFEHYSFDSERHSISPSYYIVDTKGRY
jgi:cytochrome c oxidase subunit 3